MGSQDFPKCARVCRHGWALPYHPRAGTARACPARLHSFRLSVRVLAGSMFAVPFEGHGFLMHGAWMLRRCTESSGCTNVLAVPVHGTLPKSGAWSPKKHSLQPPCPFSIPNRQFTQLPQPPAPIWPYGKNLVPCAFEGKFAEVLGAHEVREFSYGALGPPIEMHSRAPRQIIAPSPPRRALSAFAIP
jgi:hypothetical protein